ncbi:MAG TPA: HAD-IA family hydrolase [Vicinamibacterales bacterium]|nr:HAD-IA family hydrolase [Vicinamibacterales bacterium]
MPLIVFDLDGTLIDSQRDLADAANALIVERGGAPLAVDAIAGMVGEGAALLVGRALRARGLDGEDPTALPRFLELYDERLLAHTRLYAGVRETLGALHPRVPLAILTNKPQHATDRILEGLDVARFFRWVLGGDTPSGRKPEPDGLRHLMSEASATAADTIMVGDSAIDLKTARAAGTRICLARYGFGFRGVDGLLTGDEMLIDRPERLVDLV